MQYWLKTAKIPLGQKTAGRPPSRTNLRHQISGRGPQPQCGRILFHTKEYAEAEAKLTYRAFENPNFSIMADLLLIKIYYETDSELLESRMKALEQKVRRSKISAETKAGYYNFLKKLDKVIKYGWQKSSPKRDKLVEEIKTTPSVIDREWLLSNLK